MDDGSANGDRARRGHTPVRTAALVVALIAATLGLAVPAAATPVPARIVGETVQRGGEIEVAVRSVAMRRVVPVKVWPARGHGPAPTLYLLNGAAGGEGGSSWFDRTDIRTFFADKNVTVVVPMGGAASYFTDWQRSDPVLGRQKWATFLTEELPATIDERFDGTGRNAIAGISMAGTSVFQLALHAPSVYRAIGSFSGCAQTSDPLGQSVVRMVVEGRGGANTLNMWGPPDDPAWRANDPYLHAEAFRGTSIYVSNGSGMPGRYDTLDGPGIEGNGSKLFDQIAVGAVIETATAQCTRNLQRRMHDIGVPATFHLYEGGTHAWPYWQDELHRAWPQFEAALRG